MAIDAVRDNPNVGRCSGIVREVIQESGASIEEDIVAGRSSAEKLTVTVKPAGEKEAEMFLLLETSGATLFAGVERVRFEWIGFASMYTSREFAHEFRSVIEAIVAGRIQDTTTKTRSGRTLRVRTEIVLENGERIQETSVRSLRALRTVRELRRYAAYS